MTMSFAQCPSILSLLPASRTKIEFAVADVERVGIDLRFEGDLAAVATSVDLHASCTDCQMLSGSAFRVNIQAPAEHFVLLSGTTKTYIKTTESGNKRLHDADVAPRLKP
jgi:hypothetical protein